MNKPLFPLTVFYNLHATQILEQHLRKAVPARY